PGLLGPKAKISYSHLFVASLLDVFGGSASFSRASSAHRTLTLFSGTRTVQGPWRASKPIAQPPAIRRLDGIVSTPEACGLQEAVACPSSLSKISRSICAPPCWLCSPELVALAKRAAIAALRP